MASWIIVVVHIYYATGWRLPWAQRFFSSLLCFASALTFYSFIYFISRRRIFALSVVIARADQLLIIRRSFNAQANTHLDRMTDRKVGGGGGGWQQLNEFTERAKTKTLGIIIVTNHKTRVHGARFENCTGGNVVKQQYVGNVAYLSSLPSSFFFSFSALLILL